MEKKLRILFISREYPPETGGGGIGTFLFYIAPALIKKGHEVHVLSYFPGQIVKDYLDRGVHIRRRGKIYIRGLSYIEKIVRLPETIARIHIGISTYIEFRRLGMDFDVIEYPDWGAEGWLFSLIHRKPLVAHLHTPLAIINRYVRKNENFDIRFASFLERLSVNNADFITSSSLLLVKELTKIGWLRNKNCEVIPYPISFAPLEHLDPVRNTPPNILFIGRIESRKAPEILLEAIYSLRKRIPGVKGIFVGRSNGQRDGKQYLEWIKNSFPGVENIAEFPGEVNLTEIPKFISDSRVVVIPSWFESYSIAALEAMAGGRPVVVTKTCGVSELIEQTGCGKIVPPGDPASVAEAIEPFLKDVDYAESVGSKAKETIRKELNPEKISEQRERIYKKAISLFKHNYSKRKN